jgi:hypothetical protein
MAAKERLSEEIKYTVELLRLIWLSLIAVGSGTVGLLLGELSVRKIWAASIGAVFMVLFAGVILQLHRRARSLIAQLEGV